MNKQQLQNLVEEYINEAVEETDTGNWCWCGGSVEDYLKSNLTEADMQLLEDILCGDYRVSYCEVYTDDDGFVTIDCNFYTDVCEQTCRSAVLFHNTRTGEKYYLQHSYLWHDEEDEDTDAELIKQAEIFEKTGYNLDELTEFFRIVNVRKAFGIRRIIQTIEMKQGGM